MVRNPEYFITIVEAGSLTKSGEKMLYVSQPYLSQYLKHLEQSLGVELSITLSHRSHRPTPVSYFISTSSARSGRKKILNIC